MSGWTDAQVQTFGRRFAVSHKATWPAYVADVREALIDSFVLLIVLGQDRSSGAVEIKEIQSLRTRLGIRIARAHWMANPTVEQATEPDAGGAGGVNRSEGQT